MFLECKVLIITQQEQMKYCIAANGYAMISGLFLSLAMKCTAGNFSFQTCFSLENDFPKRNMIEQRSYPLVIKHGNGTFLFMRMRIDTIDYWRVRLRCC